MGGKLLKSTFIYKTPLGKVYISENGKSLTALAFLTDDENICMDFLNETYLLKEAYTQLIEYFNGTRKQFSIPLEPEGTVFQQKVWQALLEIPYGETRSYQDIATYIGNPKACRAIGMANHRNPIGIMIPCHRVIGKNGSLTGYAGGIHYKKYLLDLEMEKSYGNP